MTRYDKNYLLRAKAIQETYIEQKRLGKTNKDIYNNYINPRFFMSMATFYNYLSVPAVRELKKLEQQQNDRN